MRIQTTLFNGGYMTDLGLNHKYRGRWSPTKTVTAADIRQDAGNGGTCYLLASAVDNLRYRVQTSKSPYKLYEFQFKDERGTVNKVRVRQQFGQQFDELLEIAYARTRPGQDIYNGGFENNALSDITGQAYGLLTTDTTDDLLTNAEPGEVLAFSGHNTINVVSGHAYHVESVGIDSITLYNPWGIDNVRSLDGLQDGYITLNYTSLQAAINNGLEVRLTQENL